MFTAAQRSALPAYPPARGCDAHLNAWCDANCPHHEAHGALLARYAHSSAGPVKSWRCFARSSLEEDAQTYKAGTRTYCTRNAQLWEQLAHCRDNPPPSPPAPPPQVDVAVKPSGEASVRPQPSPKLAARSAGPAAEAWIDGPQPVPLGWRGASSRPLSPAEAAAAPPHYEHDPELLSLSPRIPVPRREDCDYALAGPPTFVGISMYTDAYAHKAQYLLTSCVGVGVCCALSHVPNDAFGSDALAGAERQGKENQGKVPNYFRHRLIASKPLFILEALRASALPVAWMDVDLEFHQPPLLFAPGSWGTARDVLLWNWQGNVSMFKGRRLKMASGVAFFNKTAPAEALLTAWAEVMAYPPNSAAPDDQAMDEIVNGDGWIDRVTWGWLPAKYLRMAHRHASAMPTADDCVLNHDRDAMPGRGNSPIKPVLPPHAFDHSEL